MFSSFQAASHDWQPVAPLANLRLRAELLARIRQFFAARALLEVETPALSQAVATDPHLQSFAVPFKNSWRYLQTSPELPMKRLLAAGSGDIYQICKVFRAGETGRLHNVEFTLVEWYRVGFDHCELMDEVEALVRMLLPASASQSKQVSYRETFESYAGFNPFDADAERFIECLNGAGIVIDANSWAIEDLVDLVAAEIVYPQLGHDGLYFVYDYPASQAALAQVRTGTPPVAERFELFFKGVELANGFHELRDAVEQRRRFEADLAQRQRRGLPQGPIDERFLAALRQGFPECAGVALGFDRVAMLAASAGSLDDVLAFPADRA